MQISAALNFRVEFTADGQFGLLIESKGREKGKNQANTYFGDSIPVKWLQETDLAQNSSE